MFTTLNALAQQATLMITIAAEGDCQLRVNVTPMPADTKAKSKLPAPLSLLGTPTEFDADFIAALSTWQAPKRTLLQQAQEAVGLQAPATTSTGGAAAGTTGTASKPDEKQEKGKAGRKARADKSAAPAPAPAAGAAPGMDWDGEAAAGAGAAAGAADAAGDDVAADAAAGGADVVPGAADAGADAVPGGADASAAAGAGAAGPAPGDDQVVDKFTLDLF